MNSEDLLEVLLRSAHGETAAIRAITKLEPAGGAGGKVFPPTYEGGKYADETWRLDGRDAKSVLLDSPQSQANRFEEALLRAHQAGRLSLPVFEVTIPNHEPVTSFTAPHRIHDAIFRDCTLKGVLFRQTAIGKAITAARLWNATAFFEYAPNVLLFGSWDSQSGGGTNTAKIARALVSEIVATDMVEGVRTSSRIDPLGIKLIRDVIVKSDVPGELWRFQEPSGEVKKGKKAASDSSLKPSEINHGNVTPSISNGGVTFGEASQTTIISFAQLRRLRFPDGDGKSTVERDAAGRAVIAALGLCAVTLFWDDGFDLRSRCQLIPMNDLEFEVVGRTTQEKDRKPLPVTTGIALEALEKTLDKAREHGLSWQAGTVALEPRQDLVKLVELSDRAAGGSEEGTQP